MRDDIGFALLAVLVMGAGVGHAAGASPFLVCGAAALAMVAFSPHRRRVRAALANSEHRVRMMFLLLVGAAFSGLSWMLVGSTAALAALRVGTKYGLGRLRLSRAPGLARWNTGLLTAAQGRIGLALGLSCYLAYESAGDTSLGGGNVILAIAVLGTLLTQLLAVPLAHLAFTNPPLTSAPPAAELSPTSSTD